MIAILYLSVTSAPDMYIVLSVLSKYHLRLQWVSVILQIFNPFSPVHVLICEIFSVHNKPQTSNAPKFISFFNWNTFDLPITYFVRTVCLFTISCLTAYFTLPVLAGLHDVTSRTTQCLNLFDERGLFTKKIDTIVRHMLRSRLLNMIIKWSGNLLFTVVSSFNLASLYDFTS